MNKFTVLEINNPLWSVTVEHSLEYDFYHTQSYHALEKENRPVLCVLNFGNDFIAMPFIIRAIPNSIYFDCTSVYGYSGPISNLLFDTISKEKRSQFHDQIVVFFKENNIIAAFSRLHPLIQNFSFFDDSGIVNHLNKTVAIDLRLSLEEQRAQYRKSNKYEISQLRKNGFVVEKTNSKEAIDAFVAIYHETMSRVEASGDYYHDHNYFYNFLENNCFNSILLIAKKEGEIVAGAIFTVTNKIMQYHLAGTANKYNKMAPMKLILDEARILGNAMHLDFLHLGGGVGGNDEDSLFNFKAGFSDSRFQFKTWQLIVDLVIYRKLVMNNEIIASNFFPLYRSKKLNKPKFEITKRNKFTNTNNKEMKNILITSAGRRVSLVRYFKKELNFYYPEAMVYTTDADPEYSAACRVSDGYFKVARVTESDYIEEILQLVLKNNIKLIIPTIDTELLILSQNITLFKSHEVEIVISDYDQIKIFRDKRLTHQFFEKLGINCAKEFDKNNYNLPLYIKPIDGSRSIDNFVINFESDLTEYHFLNDKLMFLEYLDHNFHTEFTIDMYYDRNSNLKCLIPRERLEVRDGEVNKAITRDHSFIPEIWDKMKFIEGFHGCITLQVFVNSNTDEVYGIEINPRFGGGFPLSYLAGGNFPKWIIEEYILDKKEIEIYKGWEKNLLMLRYDDEIIICDYNV